MDSNFGFGAGKNQRKHNALEDNSDSEYSEEEELA
jgi:hypothetical protein